MEPYSHRHQPDVSIYINHSIIHERKRAHKLLLVLMNTHGSSDIVDTLSNLINYNKLMTNLFSVCLKTRMNCYLLWFEFSAPH